MYTMKDGNTFTSLREISRYYGMSHGTLCKQVNNGKNPADLVESALKAREKSQKLFDNFRVRTVKEACELYNIDRTVVYKREADGIDIIDAIKMGNTVSKSVTYKNKTYKSLKDLCTKLGLNYNSVHSKLDKNPKMTTDELIEWAKAQKQKKSKIPRLVTSDGKQEFKSINHLADSLNISHLACKKALEKYNYNVDEVIKQFKEKPTQEDIPDPTGKPVHYKSLREMCEAYNIPITTYLGRIGSDWTPEKALTTPIDKKSAGTRKIKIFDKEYNSIQEAVDEFKVDRHNINRALYTSGWDIEVAFSVYSNKQESEKVTLGFIGLDGQAYYRVSWLDKNSAEFGSGNIQTAREVIDHFRPDLIQIYDKVNPTGQYHPYRIGETEIGVVKRHKRT